MARLFLTRHGDALPSQKDVVLSKEGLKQAKMLARRLQRIEITKAFVSDLTRAKQTFQEYHKLKPQIPFQITKELREIYRVLVGGPVREGTPPSREAEDRERADKAFNHIIEELKHNDNILLFIHGNLIRYFLAKVFNPPKVNLWESIQVDNASISLIEYKDGRLSIKMINDTGHVF
jgi:broad specificity phosphatase PhoE